MRRIPPIAAVAVAVAAVLALLLPLVGGCSVIRGDVEEGSDPVVVGAESVQRTSHASIKTFLQAEHENREAIRADLPALHAFAERLRVEEPDAQRKLSAAIAGYKAARDAAARETLDERLAVLSALAAQARTYLVTLDERGLRKP